MKTKHTLFVLALLLIGILLSACEGNVQLNELATDTLSPSLTPSPTASPMPSLTPSTVPSLTPSLTEPPTSTPTPSVSPLPLVITDALPNGNMDTNTNSLGHVMSLIPAGAFQMGSID